MSSQDDESSSALEWTNVTASMEGEDKSTTSSSDFLSVRSEGVDGGGGCGGEAESFHSCRTEKTEKTASEDSLTVKMGSGNAKNKKRKLTKEEMEAAGLDKSDAEKKKKGKGKSISLVAGKIKKKSKPLQRPKALLSGNLQQQEKDDEGTESTQQKKSGSLLSGSFIVTTAPTEQEEDLEAEEEQEEEEAISQADPMTTMAPKRIPHSCCEFCELVSFETEHEMMVHQLGCSYNDNAPLYEIPTDKKEIGATTTKFDDYCTPSCKQPVKIPPVKAPTITTKKTTTTTTSNNVKSQLKDQGLNNPNPNTKKETPALKQPQSPFQSKPPQPREKHGFFKKLFLLCGCTKSESILDSVVLDPIVISPKVEPSSPVHVRSPTDSLLPDDDDSTIATLVNDDQTLDLTLDQTVDSRSLLEIVENQRNNTTNLIDIDINVEKFIDTNFDEGKSISALWRGRVDGNSTDEIVTIEGPRFDHVPSEHVFRALLPIEDEIYEESSSITTTDSQKVVPSPLMITHNDGDDMENDASTLSSSTYKNEINNGINVQLLYNSISPRGPLDMEIEAC